MAILGNGGILELSREWPDPKALAPSALNLSTQTLSIDDSAYWNGDRVIISCADGVPIDVNGDGFADNPEGHGVYFGGIYEPGPSRVHVTASTDNYYQGTNSVAFYNTAATTGFTTQTDAYINIDVLDRVKFYNNAVAAYNADVSGLVEFKKVLTDNLVIARYSSDVAYAAAVDTAAADIQELTLPSSSQDLATVIPVPSAITAIDSDPDSRGWLIQCDLTEWALSVDAANLDMTAIGETFGENTKSLVRGAGSLKFLVDQRYKDGEQTSMDLLRLVMLTERQGEADAKFYLYENRTPDLPQIGSTAYYNCKILLTNTRIDVRSGDMITGSGDFVATGEIALKFQG